MPTTAYELRMRIERDDSLPLQEHPKHEKFLCVDLGRQRDHTTMVALEAKPTPSTNLAGEPILENRFFVRGIERLPLGIDYTEVYELLFRAFHDKNLWLQRFNHSKIEPWVLVDVGGPGHPVADDLEKRIGGPVQRITLTAGAFDWAGGPSKSGSRVLNSFSVPRNRVFGMLDAAFSSREDEEGKRRGRIYIDKKLPLAKPLINELKNLVFVQNEASPTIRVVHRQSEHDDLAIALGLGVWWVDEGMPKYPPNLRQPRPRFQLLEHRDYMPLFKHD